MRSRVEGYRACQCAAADALKLEGKGIDPLAVGMNSNGLFGSATLDFVGPGNGAGILRLADSGFSWITATVSFGYFSDSFTQREYTF
jgi:hypothetical protein